MVDHAVVRDEDIDVGAGCLHEPGIDQSFVIVFVLGILHVALCEFFPHRQAKMLAALIPKQIVLMVVNVFSRGQQRVVHDPGKILFARMGPQGGDGTVALLLRFHRLHERGGVRLDHLIVQCQDHLAFAGAIHRLGRVAATAAVVLKKHHRLWFHDDIPRDAEQRFIRSNVFRGKHPAWRFRVIVVKSSDGDVVGKERIRR
mmetsp:Transcript_24997/g.70163  ORF Transcript_24997/g.70163 Transcript_24997/m.70163 type:complete len:201 (-) Transcript_24997:274-876(-)